MIRRLIGLLVITLIAACVVIMLPPVADHFGYARPIPGGLPHRFAVDVPFTRMSGCVHIGPPERTWSCRHVGSPSNLSASCSSYDEITAANPWRDGTSELGTIPTLLVHPYSVWVWNAPTSGGPPYNLAFVEDGSCFVIYHRSD